MSETLIILLSDSDLLRSRDPELWKFKHLPFAIEHPSLNIPEEDVAGRIRDYPDDRIRFLFGLDYLLENKMDVLNISLGPVGHQFDEKDPLQVATKYVHSLGVPVVVAAGNDGPSLDTLQPLARAPWVISVGAADLDRKLLKTSSRGVPGGVHPTVVSLGLSSFMLDKDFKKPDHWYDYGPSTSFAAPWITRIAACLYKSLQVIFLDVRDVTRGSWNIWSDPIRLPYIGLPDTGLDPKYLPKFSPIIESLLKSGSNSFRLTRPDRLRKWYEGLFSQLVKWGLTCDITFNPRIVKQILESIAIKMDGYEKHEAGAGFVGPEELKSFIHSFTPSVFVELFSRGEVSDDHQSRLRLLDGILGPLWDEQMATVIWEYFYNGIMSICAKIQ